MLDVSIWRGGPAGQSVAFQVPRRPNQTILDVVTWIQRYAAPDLAYRFACRVGMCGSCAMMVNGIPRWTCRTRVEVAAPDGKLDIRPLRNLPQVKDLVTDMEGFFDHWASAGGAFQPSAAEVAYFATIPPTDRNRREADAGVECIGCGICFAACDTVADTPDYLGPAALNRAWVAFSDRRDGDPKGHLRAAAADGGAHRCHSQGSCTRFCPVSLDPRGALAGLKRSLLWRKA